MKFLNLPRVVGAKDVGIVRLNQVRKEADWKF